MTIARVYRITFKHFWWNFQDPIISFYTKLLATDRQTDRQTPRIT